MHTIDLCGEWKGVCVYPNGDTFSFTGEMPGCAIQHLRKIGRLPEDLYWEKNADSVTEFENCDFYYSKTFIFQGEKQGAKLFFERIDTYCDLFLNGKKIYHSENGNIAHEISVEEVLLQGENILEARLYSPILWVKDRPIKAGAFTCERMHTRRMQCTYGWDWVARFVTCGLGACRITVPEKEEIIVDNVYIATLYADQESANVRVDVAFEKGFQPRLLEFILLDGEKTVCLKKRYCAEDFVRADFDVENPRLWYPLGYGKQPLYTFILKDGAKIIYEEKIGIRTAQIMQLPDPIESENHQKCLSIQNKDFDFNTEFSGFILKVNGEKIFCRGANWVPCVPYAIGDIAARQTEILELCAEAGVNMLRVWGGGAFETKHFYNECSRLGIMVTQDFLMACGDYPEEEEWFIKELNKEALYAARLMRNQPCLMWWSGDNENAVRGSDTDENYQGRNSAYQGIAPVLYREDPHRRFLPSSPFGGTMYASNTVGTTHNTNFIGDLFEYFAGNDLSDYKEKLKNYRARFIAEEPQMGAASLPSLRRFMKEQNIFEGEDLWLYHTKSNPALQQELFAYLTMFTEKVLGAFVDGKDRLFKLRYMQYEWVRVVMEQARREAWFCSGILFWMMNDCWPAAAGWSLIDFYNLPKDAYYAFKRCAKPLLSSIDYEVGNYKAYVMNDGEEKQLQGKMYVLSDNGKTLKKVWSFTALAKAKASTIIEEFALELQENELLICDIQGAWGKDRSFYKKGTLFLSPTSVSFVQDREKQTLTVTANHYVHAVTFTGEAVFTDNCFSLLPGESRTICYRGLEMDAEITVEAYTLAEK